MRLAPHFIQGATRSPRPSFLSTGAFSWSKNPRAWGAPGVVCRSCCGHWHHSQTGSVQMRERLWEQTTPQYILCGSDEDHLRRAVVLLVTFLTCCPSVTSSTNRTNTCFIRTAGQTNIPKSPNPLNSWDLCLDGDRGCQTSPKNQNTPRQAAMNLGVQLGKNLGPSKWQKRFQDQTFCSWSFKRKTSQQWLSTSFAFLSKLLRPLHVKSLIGTTKSIAANSITPS